MTRMTRLALILALILAVAPQPAYAYIDPGLGSLLFQSVVAGFLAVAAAWAGFKLKIMSLFSRHKDEPKANKAKE